MDFLARDSVELPDGFWEGLDQTVVSTVKSTLVGRRFLPLFGPLGAGADYIQIDDDTKDEAEKDGFVRTEGRTIAQLPQLFEDFTILWRDIENSGKSGYPIDYAKAAQAAQKMANKEDKLIFYGSDFLGVSGLTNQKGTLSLKKSNWTEGENAYLDIAKALSMFNEKGIFGRYSLVVSPDVFAQLYRVVPGLGIVEMERIGKVLDGRVFQSSVLKANTAFMVCSEARYMDLAVGKDIETAYLETVNMNHVFRILETAVLRLKNKNAVIRFE